MRLRIKLNYIGNVLNIILFIYNINFWTLLNKLDPNLGKIVRRREMIRRKLTKKNVQNLFKRVQ